MSRNQSSIFLTQGINIVQARKSMVSNFVAQTESSQFSEANRKSEELLQMIQQVKPHQNVSLFRQMRRQIKQSKIQGESQVLKTQKCAFIDLQYFKKCITNQPSPNFEAIQRMLDQQQLQNQRIRDQLMKIEKRVSRIQDDIG